MDKASVILPLSVTASTYERLGSVAYAGLHPLLHLGKADKAVQLTMLPALTLQYLTHLGHDAEVTERRLNIRSPGYIIGKKQ